MSILLDTKDDISVGLGPVKKRKAKFVDAIIKEVKEHPTQTIDTFIIFNLANLLLLLGIPITCIWQLFSHVKDKSMVWSESFKYIFKIFFYISGVNIETEDIKNVYHDQPVIICPNHTSYLDGPIIASCITGMPARSIVAPIPYFPFPFNFWLRMIGSIDVIRDGEEKKKYHQIPRPKQALDLAVKKLRLGQSILVFPEGHMERKHHLLYFHTGPVRIALKAHKNIIPVTIVGADKVLPAKKFLLKPGKIKVVFHQPLNLEKYYGMYDDPELVRRLTWELEKDVIENLPKSFVPEPIMNHLPEYLKEKRGWE